MTAVVTAPTVGEFLERALRERGYREGQGNHTKYAACAGHADGQPWCATFVACMARTIGLTLPSYSAYTPTMAQGFKTAKAWTDDVDEIRPGDIVFFQWPGMGRIAHVGIGIQNRGDGSLLVLEGNTDSAGGRTGGQVMLKVRRANIAGAGRPAYRTTTGRPGTPIVGIGSPRAVAIKEIQRAFGVKKLTGVYGPGLARVVEDFQRKHQLEPDGVVGPATWAVLRRVYDQRVGR